MSRSLRERERERERDRQIDRESESERELCFYSKANKPPSVLPNASDHLNVSNTFKHRAQKLKKWSHSSDLFSPVSASTVIHRGRRGSRTKEAILKV